MKQITLTINEIPVSVPSGSTILDAARAAGVELPTLCAYEGLKPKAGSVQASQPKASGLAQPVGAPAAAPRHSPKASPKAARTPARPIGHARPARLPELPEQPAGQAKPAPAPSGRPAGKPAGEPQDMQINPAL